eukprot:1162057-Pelagomonas_calceolata.AAC.5
MQLVVLILLALAEGIPSAAVPGRLMLKVYKKAISQATQVLSFSVRREGVHTVGRSRMSLEAETDSEEESLNAPFDPSWEQDGRM